MKLTVMFFPRSTADAFRLWVVYLAHPDHTTTAATTAISMAAWNAASRITAVINFLLERHSIPYSHVTNLPQSRAR
jgi:hypothetical protein